MHLCAGAAGKVDFRSQEYGAQDFFGALDEMRIWRTVRTEDQINQVCTCTVCHPAER